MFRTSARFIRTFASAAVVVCVSAPFMQAATVAGRVLDSTSGLPLAGVEVLVDGQATGVTTDLMGQFKAEVGGGDRLFTFRRSGFSEQSVGPIVIAENGEAPIPDAKLTPSSADDVVTLEALTVTADVVRGSAGDLQNTRLKADVSIDFLTAEEFGKFGAGDIGESLIRVPGVSVVGGQYAVIRGLSDRYISTTLSGLKLPSPDPEKQSPQMDILPTSLIDSLVVSKTFAPQLWGESSGGGIDLTPKSFPEERQISVSYGLKVNENALDGGPGYDVPDDDRDLLARGSRSRPASVPGASSQGQSWTTSQDVALQDRDLPPGQKVTLGYGETFAIGETRTLGVNLSGSYDMSSRAREGFKQVLLLQNSTSPASSEYRSGTPSELDGGTYDYTESEIEVAIGLLANVGFEFNPENRVRLTSFWTRNGIDTAQANVGRTKLYESGAGTYVVGFDQGEQDAGYSDGFVPQSVQKFRDTKRYTERVLRVNQIGSEHVFASLADLRFSWAAQAADTYQNEPAATEAIYYEQLAENPPGSDLDFNIEPGNSGITPPGRAPLKRYWSKTVEDQVADRYDFVLPATLFADRESKFKFGAAREDTDRSYLGKADLYSSYSGLSDAERQTGPGRTIDDVFNDLIDRNPGLVSTSNRTEQSRDILAGYLGSELALPAGFQLHGGARLEKFEVATEGRDEVENYSTGQLYHVAAPTLLGTEFIPAYDSDIAAAKSHITRVAFSDDAWYPAVGVVYSPTKRINLRLNYSLTTARPSLRELGPYFNRSLESGDYVVGNPALQPSDVDNYDFRAEWFGDNGTMMAASIFSKTISEPIEKVYLPGFLTGQSVETWVNNPNEANMRGVEFEARVGLGLIDDAFRHFTIGGNLSLIDAEVEEHPEIVKQLRNNGHVGSDETVTRRLFDQPEYLANLDVTWNHGKLGTTATLAINFTSDVLAASGGGVLGVSESSLDLYTRAYERVDFFITQKIADGWKLRVGVKNLTDPVRGTIYDPEKTSGTIVRNEYRAGREYNVSLSASF